MNFAVHQKSNGPLPELERIPPFFDFHFSPKKLVLRISSSVFIPHIAILFCWHFLKHKWIYKVPQYMTNWKTASYNEEKNSKGSKIWHDLYLKQSRLLQRCSIVAYRFQCYLWISSRKGVHHHGQILAMYYLQATQTYSTYPKDLHNLHSQLNRNRNLQFKLHCLTSVTVNSSILWIPKYAVIPSAKIGFHYYITFLIELLHCSPGFSSDLSIAFTRNLCIRPVY